MQKESIKFYKPVRIWVLDKYRPWKWWYDILASDILRHENWSLSGNRNFSSYFQMTSKVHWKFVFINVFFTDGSRKNIFLSAKKQINLFLKYWISISFLIWNFFGICFAFWCIRDFKIITSHLLMFSLQCCHTAFPLCPLRSFFWHLTAAETSVPTPSMRYSLHWDSQWPS